MRTCRRGLKIAGRVDKPSRAFPDSHLLPASMTCPATQLALVRTLLLGECLGERRQQKFHDHS